MSSEDQLRKEISMLKQKTWASKEGRKADSNYFILINTNMTPSALFTYEILEAICDNFMLVFKNNIGRLITFNNNKNRKHFFSSDYVNNIKIRYCVEQGLKRKQVHIHIGLYIKHKSNITIHQQQIFDLAHDYFMDKTGKKPFVARPRLLSVDRVKEYMTKGEDFEGGVVWIVVRN